MSNSEPAPNAGAKAVDENLAGTRDEFNDEVTAAMIADAQEDSSPDDDSGSGDSPGDSEREDQPALDIDEDSPARAAKPSS